MPPVCCSSATQERLARIVTSLRAIRVAVVARASCLPLPLLRPLDLIPASPRCRCSEFGTGLGKNERRKRHLRGVVSAKPFSLQASSFSGSERLQLLKAYAKTGKHRSVPCKPPLLAAKKKYRMASLPRLDEGEARAGRELQRPRGPSVCRLERLAALRSWSLTAISF